MNKGGTGSLKLDSGKFLKDSMQVKYMDLDGQTVIITLTENDNKELVDPEFWKVDFMPLKKIPLPEELKKI